MWKKILILTLASTCIVACDEDDDNGHSNGLTLNINGLENLGSAYQYEGWIIVDGNPKSTGTFSVDDDGEMSRTSFDVNDNDLNRASAFVLTIEPNPDSDPMPSKTKILAGDFSGKTAQLDISNQSALGNDFSSASGVYILATPTTEVTTDENSGVWFIDNTGSAPAAGLVLPVLPEGWRYEGWAVINEQPVTTGPFTTVSGADNAAPFSGSLAGPPFPGEDFVQNAPTGLTFPTNLAGADIVITIEPNPDNSEAPFLLKPLKGTVPDDATDHMIYGLQMSDDSFPRGTVTRD